MIKVECPSCQAPYNVEERRIPASGLRMKCPKCASSFLIRKDGSVDANPPPVATPAPKKPAPPPPKSAATAAFEDPLADLPSLPTSPALKGPPKRPTGQTFGDLELPELPSDEPELPAAAPQRAPPPPRPRAQAPTAPAAGFGEVDLPVVAAAPPRRGTAVQPFGADLPAPAAPRPAPPKPPAPKSAAFEVDLPAPAPRGGTALQPFGEIDLPAPGRAAPPPAPSAPERLSDFGEIDLPVVGGGGGDLPALGAAALPAVGGAALPATAGIGLPAAGGVSLPAIGGPGLPATGGPGLPAPGGPGLPATGGPGLPAPGGVGLPIVGGPGLPASGGAGLPVTAQTLPAVPGQIVGAELYDELRPADDKRFHTMGRALPQAAAPLPTDVSFDLDEGEAHLGAPAPEAAAPPPPAALEAELEEQDLLGEAPLPAPPRPASDEGEELDLAKPGSGAAVGDEVDLSGSPASRGFGGAAPTAKVGATEARKPSKAGRYVVVGAVVFAIGGAALSFVPSMGPFGAYFIMDKLSAGSNRAALEQQRAQALGALDADTATEASRAIQEGRQAVEARPRHKPTAAFSAYVVYAASLRFGKRPADEQFASDLLGKLGGEKDDDLDLARAAADAVAGQLPKARDAAAAVAGRLQGDAEPLLLLGEIDLAAKQWDKAIDDFQKAGAIKKTARASYGLARALLGKGDRKGAEKAGREALAANDGHAGGRVLVARLTLADEANEKEALALLEKVVNDPVVKGGASTAEAVEGLSLLATLYAGKGKMSRVEQLYSEALKLDPQAVTPLVLSGFHYLEIGRTSEAFARFEAATKVDAEDIVARIGLARAWLKLERKVEARDLLRKLAPQAPKAPLAARWVGLIKQLADPAEVESGLDILVHHTLATAELEVGNKKEAEAALNDAIRKGGKNPAAIASYVDLSSLLTRAGRSEEATQRLAEAEAKFPGRRELHVAKGELALTLGKYDEARREFETALEKRDEVPVRFKLGVTLRRMRAFDEATKAFDKVEEADKDYPGLALERGVLFEEMGQTDRAIEFFQNALAKAPNDTDLKLRVASAQVMAGQVKLAEPVLREIVKERPTSAEAHHFLGRALLQKGSALPDALRELDRATELDNNRAEYWLYVGWAANESGNIAKADDALKKALARDQSLGDAYWQRGVLLQKQGATQDAVKELLTALEKRPSRYEAWATLALCYQDQLKWPDAEAAWRKAVAGNGSIADWRYRLGKLLYQHANEAAASPELAKAIELAEANEKQRSFPLFDAHFLYAETLKVGDKDKAIIHYKKFLSLAPIDNAYRKDAERQLLALGASPR